MTALVLQVRLHEGRYHGEGDWPPSPARLFQALVAGAGLGGPIGEAEFRALEWLERQKPPLIVSPPAWRARRSLRMYVPNNDGDAIQGDPVRMSKIRTATKVFRPWFFDAAVPFVYGWPIAGGPDDLRLAEDVCRLADHLYQFGRGIDMAWACGEIMDECKCDEMLARHLGRIWRPSAGSSATTLLAPCAGSLESLERRYRAGARRFRPVRDGGTVTVVFRQPPPAQFQLVSYDSPGSRRLYELRDPGPIHSFAPWPLARVALLVARLRDGAVSRLKRGFGSRMSDIDRALVGRKPDGTNDGLPEERVRIIPLPSIGHQHADQQIRRVLVEVPPGCPLRPDDVHWAFSGLEATDDVTGEVLHVLVPAQEEGGILHHWGADDRVRARVWRSVTPVALPPVAARRRIEPTRRREEWKGGHERAAEDAAAAAEAMQALRHADVSAPVRRVRVQREPFEGNGERVEAFAAGTRFPKERLRHLEVAFAVPVGGPLLLGDGRFLGLGLMAPLAVIDGLHAFVVNSGLAGQPEPLQLARALRRAVMARVQGHLEGDIELAPFFTGHESDGSPARRERFPHLAFAFDPRSARLLVIAPHVLDQRCPTEHEKAHLRDLATALDGFRDLRAGPAGSLELRPAWVDQETDPLFAPARDWESATPYQVTRHGRHRTAAEALAADLRDECRRRHLPVPSVEARETRGVPGVGLVGHAVLSFPVPVAGPILLGRSCHLGGGLFVGRPRSTASPTGGTGSGER